VGSCIPRLPTAGGFDPVQFLEILTSNYVFSSFFMPFWLLFSMSIACCKDFNSAASSD
jgi:hypothetical protein